MGAAHAVAMLRELGEFVKSPDTVIEPPVARKLLGALDAAEIEGAGPKLAVELEFEFDAWADRTVRTERRYLYRGGDDRYEAVAPRAEGDVMIGHRDWTISKTVYPRSSEHTESAVAGDEVFY